MYPAFQPTPSSRKVTPYTEYHLMTAGISTHTFLAEGDPIPEAPAPYTDISTHTFLAEGDVVVLAQAVGDFYFNPHLPRGR